MKRLFVDTNVFLRFLTRDDLGQSERAERLLQDAAAGQVGLVTGPPVLFELVWTLRRAYKVPRERSLDIVASLLAVEGLDMVDRSVVTAAVERGRTSGQEFADAYIAAAATGAGVDGIATFNEKHFKRLGAALYDWPPAEASAE